ncbi:MAG TPA: SdrD B-like domain-containing protein, partial [Saprospiraceae bacterium]|nr:SdrD B-like domain-containing protein [Saprospiraceae bacterium]
DVTNVNGDIGTTDQFQLYAEQTLQNLDAGFILAGGTVSGKVVVDKNLNNRLDSQDLPMPGVLVQLHNMSGLLIDSKISDTNGEYSFYPVLEGQYYLVFKKMTGYIFADPYTTGNTNTDFDVDESISSGSTTYFNVYNLQTVGHIDAGLQDARGSLSGVVWLDANSNGLLDFEPGVGNVLVELISLETNQVVETTSSNDLGQYNFNEIIPSDYFIRFSSIPSHTFFTMPDIGTNDQIDSEVTGTNGVGTTMTITVNNFEKIYNINAGLTGYGTITTKVFKDENENGLDDVNEGGVPNILVRLLRNGQLIQERESDVNGLVTFDNVLMGDYSLEYEINEKLRFTDYKVGNDDAIDSDVNTINGNIGLTNEFSIHLDEHITNINAGLIDAYGSISGVIATDGDKDDMLDLSGIDDGIPMMIVIAKNVDGTSYISQTDENGYYSFNHLIIGDYYIQFLVMPGFLYSLPYIASDPLYDFDITGTNGPGTTDIITVTQGSSTVGINAGYIDSRATLRGKFFLDNNANGVYDNEDGFVKNRKVELIKSSNGLLVDYIDTDAYGNYNFDKVIPGNYFIKFTELNSDWTFTTANVGNNDSIDSDISGANGVGTSDVFSLDYNEVKEDVYGGILGFGDISSTVFFDANENGIFDLTEIGVKGVKVTLIDANNMEVSSKITSVDGKFKFANIQAGIYHLKFEIDESYRFTTPNAGNNEFLDSDAIPSNISTGFTHDFSMIIDDTVDEVSAGLILAKNTINGYVVNDLNRNNIKDASDAMMSLTKVSLFKSNGTLVTETMTNTDGYFEMNDVVVGDYYLLFEPFEGYVYSQAQFSGDDNVDFQVTGNKGLGTTDVFQLTGQTTTYTFNAGYIDARGTIQGMVWYDKNNNGIKESNESFVANHTVKLYDEAGTLKDEKTTNQLGNYQFDQLLFDNYYVVFSDLVSDQFWSPANQTSDETLDCDVTQSIVSNSTDYIEIIEFSQVAGVNAGISGYASISGTVFEDANDNGILDTDDFGLENFDVQLLTSAGTVFKTTKSLADGTYSFNQLTPGNYKIQISIPSGYQFVAANQGADDSVDSEIVNVAGQTGSTDLLTVAYQMNLSDIHIGLLPSLGTISGKVVYDVNSNNQLDSPDAGIDNHIVNLYAADGTLKATKMTNAEGKYIFS